MPTFSRISRRSKFAVVSAISLIAASALAYPLSENLSWNKTIDGVGHGDDAVRASASLKFNDVVFVGSGKNLVGPNTRLDWWIARYTETGALRPGFPKYYDGAGGDDEALAVTSDGQGGFFVAGFGSNLTNPSSGLDGWIKRFTSDGDEDPSFQIIHEMKAQNTDEIVHSIAYDQHGGLLIAYQAVLLVGSQFETNAYIERRRVSDGQLEMWTSFGDNKPGIPTIPHAILVDAQNNFYVAAEAGGMVSSSSGSDWSIVRFDSSGNQVWRTNFGSSGTDIPYAMASAHNGLYVAGFGTNFASGASGKDALLRLFDMGTGAIDPTTNWNQAAHTGADDVYYDIALYEHAAHGQVVAVGTQNGMSSIDWRVDEFDDFFGTALSHVTFDGAGSRDVASTVTAQHPVGVGAGNPRVYVGGYGTWLSPAGQVTSDWWLKRFDNN